MLLLVVSNNFDLTVVGNAEAPADTSSSWIFRRLSSGFSSLPTQQLHHIDPRNYLLLETILAEARLGLCVAAT